LEITPTGSPLREALLPTHIGELLVESGKLDP